MTSAELKWFHMFLNVTHRLRESLKKRGKTYLFYYQMTLGDSVREKKCIE